MPFAFALTDSFAYGTLFAEVGPKVVHQSVAVVIFSIAGFFDRLLGIAIHPLASVARFKARTTDRLARSLDGFVDVSITVVVDVVAVFELGLVFNSVALDIRFVLFANKNPRGFANPETVGAGLFFLWPIFVDVAIAVVVFAVASFDARCSRLGRTFHIGCGLVTHPSSGADTFSNASCTGCAFLAPKFVDLAVAVVILTVADFFAGLAGLLGTHDFGAVGLADEDAGSSTVSLTNGARRVEGRPVFVDGTIAVVVLAVTSLWCGLTGRTVDPGSCVAGFGPRFTLRGAGLGQVFINGAVAVIVFVVARFCCGGSRLDGTFDAGAGSVANPFA